MKIIQLNGGYTPEELISYRFIVHGNCISQMKVLVQTVLKQEAEFENPENKKRAEKLSKVPPSGDSWSQEIGEDIKALWADPIIQTTYQQRDKQFQLDDSAQ
jgi:hypothetical protein